MGKEEGKKRKKKKGGLYSVRERMMQMFQAEREFGWVGGGGLGGYNGDARISLKMGCVTAIRDDVAFFKRCRATPEVHTARQSFL